VSDGIAQLTEPFMGCFFDDRFAEAHDLRRFVSKWKKPAFSTGWEVVGIMQRFASK
jgi:hypothetical protein